MTNKVTEISQEALNPVVASMRKAAELAQVAEKATKDARMAELEFEVQRQKLYLDHALDRECQVNTATGEVTWPGEAEVTEPAQLKPRKKVSKKVSKKVESTNEAE